MAHHGGSKVKAVLRWTLVGIVVILILAWLIAGGIGKIQNAAENFAFPPTLSGLKSFGSGFTLPWALPAPRGPDISTLLSGGSSQASTFGNTSPYSSAVSLSADGAQLGNPEDEYVIVENMGSQAIDITGWSLQSAITGARAYLPRAANFFRLGTVNQQTDTYLGPGGLAIVTTGLSPVGTSFRENECSGYLGQLQQYSPPIQEACPDPSIDVSAAQAYGDACAQYVSSLPACTFQTRVPSNLPLGCQEFVQDTFSYNGCVDEHRGDPSFASDTWRLYLGGAHELWNNDHDTIRLLDAQGQIVAATSY